MKKSTKKVMAMLSSTALLAGILAGCGSSSSISGANSGSGEQTITLMIDNQSPADGIKAVAADIEKKYHIKTKIDLRPGGGQGDNLIKTQLATGDADDLLYYNSGSLMQQLNPEKNFLDLTNEPYMSNVMDSFKQTVAVNGKVYGAPAANASVGAWLYNKKVYAQLGLTVPKTWAELMANNEKIKAAGKVPVIGTFKDDWTSQLVFLADYYNVNAQDPSFAADLTANKAKFANTPAALRSFEKLSELKQKGDLNKDFLTTTYDTGLKMLVDGTGVQYPILSNALTNIATNYPDKINDIGIFPQPSDSPNVNGFTAWEPAAFYVNKSSQHLDAVKKWLSYFESPEGIKTYLENQKVDGPLVIKGVTLPSNVIPAVKDMLPYFNSGKTTPALEFASPLKGPDLPQITQEVGSGMTSAKAGAALYDQDLAKAAQQLGLKGWQ